MKTIKTRELIEAARILAAHEQPPFDKPGYAYAVTKSYVLQALSIDGVFELAKVGIHHNGETVTDFGSLGGCSNKSEADALADIQQYYK